MTKRTIAPLTALFTVFAHTLTAQQLPRPELPRTVTLALAEYNRLVDLASRPPQGPSIAPVAAVVASTELRVRVERATARGAFTLTGETLRAGLSKVNLLSGATLVEASAAGRPLPLIAEGNAHTALVPGPSPFVLTLEWGAPLTFVPGRASFVLPVPQSGTAQATIDVPGDQADVHLSAGLITRRTTNAGRTIVEATLDPGSATEVWWSMRDSAPVAATREARALADVLTLLTLGDSDVRMVALVDLTIVQGEPRAFEVRLPSGYELTSISGSTLETSEQREGSVLLTIGDLTARRHQFLFSLERTHDGGSFMLETPFLSVVDVQRERGEIAVEGVGTLDLTPGEREGLHRIDVRELNQALQSLARTPILSAFRYQRSAASPPMLALDVKRFADAGVLAAVADHAAATTLVTAEGRALTEVTLRLRNRAQAFLNVTLPPGASMVSVEVAGEAAKPALGADGTRVPLLRPGFRPNGPYTVSFVYLHPGTPFGRKGDIEMTLPKMDMPVGLVEWEVFVPDSYSMRAIDGNVLERRAFKPFFGQEGAEGGGADRTDASSVGGVGSGRGQAADRVTVNEEDKEKDKNREAQKKAEPSQNVINLQRRAAGVLPVRVDVPRAGTSHQFVKPLVVDQETRVSFRYKQR